MGGRTKPYSGEENAPRVCVGHSFVTRGEQRRRCDDEQRRRCDDERDAVVTLTRLLISRSTSTQAASCSAGRRSSWCTPRGPCAWRATCPPPWWAPSPGWATSTAPSTPSSTPSSTQSSRSSSRSVSAAAAEALEAPGAPGARRARRGSEPGAVLYTRACMCLYMCWQQLLWLR